MLDIDIKTLYFDPSSKIALGQSFADFI